MPDFPQDCQKPPNVSTYLLAASDLHQILEADGPPPGISMESQRQWLQCIRTLSYDCLGMRSEWREPTTAHAFSPALTRLVLQGIQRRRVEWGSLLRMLINVFAGTYVWCAERFLAAGVVETLQSLMDPTGLDSNIRTSMAGLDVSDVALWCALSLSNVAHASAIVANGLKPLIPSFVARLEGSDLEAKWGSKQVELRQMAFRALCALAPPAHAALERLHPHVDDLVGEYAVALAGGQTPGLGMLPHADTRAQTVLLLAKVPSHRAALVAAGALPLLARSLTAEVPGNVAATQRLWSHAVHALHFIATTRDHHDALLSTTDVVPGLLSVAGRVDPRPEAATRALAADAAVALGARWDCERLLWLAVLKNCVEDGCLLATIPAALVRVVMKWVVLQEAADGELQPIPDHFRHIEEAQEEGSAADSESDGSGGMP